MFEFFDSILRRFKLKERLVLSFIFLALVIMVPALVIFYLSLPNSKNNYVYSQALALENCIHNFHSLLIGERSSFSSEELRSKFVSTESSCREILKTIYPYADKETEIVLDSISGKIRNLRNVFNDNSGTGNEAQDSMEKAARARVAIMADNFYLPAGDDCNHRVYYFSKLSGKEEISTLKAVFNRFGLEERKFFANPESEEQLDNLLKAIDDFVAAQKLSCPGSAHDQNKLGAAVVSYLDTVSEAQKAAGRGSLLPWRAQAAEAIHLHAASHEEIEKFLKDDDCAEELRKPAIFSYLGEKKSESFESLFYLLSQEERGIFYGDSLVREARCGDFKKDFEITNYFLDTQTSLGGDKRGNVFSSFNKYGRAIIAFCESSAKLEQADVFNINISAKEAMEKESAAILSIFGDNKNDPGVSFLAHHYKDRINQQIRAASIFAFSLSVIAIFMATIFSWFSYKTMFAPLEGLTEKIIKYRKGEKNLSFRNDKNDEISYLANVFADLTEEVEGHKRFFNDKLEEKTKSIVAQQADMEDQQKAILNILEDIEEERDRLAAEKDKINAILYSIGDAVFVVNKNLEITMFNKVAEGVSGFKSEEVLGKRFFDILKFVSEENGDYRGDFIDKVVASGKEGRLPAGSVLLDKNGKKVPVDDSAAPLKDKDGKTIGSVVVFRDVTHERAVDRAKSEFVSLASHQLRTPLTAINWYLEMLMSGDAGKINKEQKEYLGEIYSGSRRMIDLVNALLNTSRIDMGTFAVDPKPTDVKAVCQSVIKELAQQISLKKLAIKSLCAKNLPLIKADPKLTRIIFQNLISNAVKYTPKKGEVKITISLEKDSILIKVADTGCGIPADQQKNIFNKLFRADNAKEIDADGNGLGLYIVKAIVDRSGGKIWFVSREDKGTTFHVSLPLSGMGKKEGAKTLA